MSSYDKPLPTPTPDSQPFWDACRNGELTCQQCDDCGKIWFPPSRYCPACLSKQNSWVPVSGKGSVYSFTVFRRAYHPGFANQIPYVVALVELDEGPRMMSTLVEVDPEQVRCGTPVQVRFEKATEEITLPMFTPIST